MQAVLITLGILGFGAVVISVYVFTVAARRYVHDRVDEGAYTIGNPVGENYSSLVPVLSEGTSTQAVFHCDWPTARWLTRKGAGVNAGKRRAKG